VPLDAQGNEAWPRWAAYLQATSNNIALINFELFPFGIPINSWSNFILQCLIDEIKFLIHTTLQRGLVVTSGCIQIIKMKLFYPTEGRC